MVTAGDSFACRRVTHHVAMTSVSASRAIAASASGCTVTETWTDRRNLLIAKLGGVFSGVADRPTFNRTSIEFTLERLDATATT